ncbi:hypothetical protein D9619_003261 [Psilocybe cf. subviscida]|uniref:Uncharacterized protein n=1 Tax=Psilocybe cf. subviscida TaxID=2480587 RepID=A0A8H5AYE9_9AGAR|nr:hypothetical protein D9619_003261 [Psilocybe cf. subviscida]
MLSAVYRLRPHTIRTNAFKPRCLHLSLPKNANSSPGLIRSVCLAGTRHASNDAAAHISLDSGIPQGVESTSSDSSSKSSTESATTRSSVSTSLDPSSSSSADQSSLPIQKKHGRSRKETQLEAENVLQPITDKTQRRTLTIEHEEPEAQPNLSKESTQPKELPKAPKSRKEPKPSKEPKKAREPNAPKEFQSSQEPELPKAPEPPKKSRKSKASNEAAVLEDPKPTKKPKTSKEPRAPEEAKAREEPKDSGEPKLPKKPKSSKEPAKSKEARKPKKAKVPRKIADLPPKQIEHFLDRIAEEGGALTIAEVERYKPAVRPSESSPKYEPEYEDLMSILLRSFRVEQFEEIVALYGLKPAPGSSRTKKEFAALLMEKAWGWKTVEKVQEEKRDREDRVDTNIPLKPLEISLLSGQGHLHVSPSKICYGSSHFAPHLDGSRLQEVAARYDVKLQLNRSQTSLRLIGRLGHAKRFQGYLNNFRQEIVTEEITLPPGSHLANIGDHTFEAVTRITGAFIEKEGGKLYASFLRNHRQASERARYLIAQVLSEERIFALPGALLSGSPSLYTNHNTPISYSLFPFSAHRTPSWKDPNRSTFRLRRIGHWLDTIHPRDGTGLEDILRQTSSVILGHNHPTGLCESLTAPFPPENVVSDILISATCGHVLFSTPPSQRHSLRPPLPGQLTINKIVGQSEAMSIHQNNFHPCAPSNLESQAPQCEERIRKLIYIAYQSQNTAEQLNETLVFEVKGEQDAPETDTKACYLQKEFVIELSMPDRPLDVQISATSYESIDSSDWSGQFDSMNDATDKCPHIPLDLALRGKTYTLLSYLTIDRKHHQVGSQSSERVIVDKIRDNFSGLTSSLAKVRRFIPSRFKGFIELTDTLE